MTDELERLAFAAKQLLDCTMRSSRRVSERPIRNGRSPTGSTVPSIPVNPDVLESIRNPSTAIPTIDAQLRTAPPSTGPHARLTNCHRMPEYADALWRRLHAHL